MTATPTFDRHKLGAACILATLVTLHVALFAYAALVTDSGRDLANAWAVGHGGPYPAYGPSLFGHWKLGPVWFWILALPLRFVGSITAASLFVGLLAAAKIPLAYGLGRRMVDCRFGVIAAILIALPGWDSEGTLVIAHTSVVETTVLATFWLALAAWQTQRAGFAVAASLMLALALHAHPTTLIAAPAVALALWRAVLLPRRWLWLLACVAVFVLPFLPALVAEARDGFPQLASTASYLHESAPGARLARVPQVLWALVSGGAWFANRYLLPAPMASVWWLGHSILVGLALVGGLRLALGRSGQDHAFRAARRWLVVLLPASLAAVVFIVLLRDATPAWMVYSLAPFGVFLLALGGYGLLQRGAGTTVVIAILAVVGIGVNLGLLQQRAALEDAGRIRLPAGSFDDIALWRTATDSYSPWLSVRQFDALAQYACASLDPLVLHGELATNFDFSQGVAARLHCPTDRLPRLAGRAGSRHLAGVAIALARDLGFEPAPQRFGHVLRVPTHVLAPERGRICDVDVRYRMERQIELDGNAFEPHTGRLRCATGELLVVTNLMPIVNPMTLTILHGRERVNPRVASFTASYYVCTGDEWQWRFTSPDPASIDMVVIALHDDGWRPSAGGADGGSGRKLFSAIK